MKKNFLLLACTLFMFTVTNGQDVGLFKTVADYLADKSIPCKSISLSGFSGNVTPHVVYADGKKEDLNNTTYWGFKRKLSKKSELVTYYRFINGKIYSIYLSGDIYFYCHWRGKFYEGKDGIYFEAESLREGVMLSKGPDVEIVSNVYKIIDPEYLEKVKEYAKSHSEIKDIVQYYNCLKAGKKPTPAIPSRFYAPTY